MKKKPRLQRSHKNTLIKASPTALLDVLVKDVGKNARRNKWLLQSNIYKKDCIKEILKRERVKKPNPRIPPEHNQLAQYIAFSAPTHCIDGWSFLARALSALWSGDISSVIHFAYYAELRASMSLLATQGVGVFNSHHYSVDKNGNCLVIPEIPTHDLAWEALVYWSSLRRSYGLVGKIIRPVNIEFDEWVRNFGPSGIGSYSRAVAQKWFTIWGIDIKRMADKEHVSRNESSYRPQPIHVVPSLKERWEFLSNMWSLCQPNPSARFDLLDRQILRTTLHRLRDANPTSVPFSDFQASTRIMTSRVLTSTPISVLDLYNNFFDESISSNPCQVISLAEKDDGFEHKDYPLQVLSRAFLLLRVATGANEVLLRESSFNREKLNFWWRPFLLERGLWAENEMSEFEDPDSSLCLLWAEIEDALSTIEDWVATTPTSLDEYGVWKSEVASSMITLTESERIGLWGVGL